MSGTKNFITLPNIDFFSVKMGFNLTFSPKDLFIEKSDKLFFLIGYDEHKFNEWNFGTVFLEKYNTVFDPEAKRLKVLRVKTDINYDKFNQNSPKTGKILLAIALTLTLSAIVFCFLGLNYGKRIYQARKIKANELEDENYEYLSEGNMKKKANKGNFLYDGDINNKIYENKSNFKSMEMTKTTF